MLPVSAKDVVRSLEDELKESKLRLINKKHNAFIGSLLYDLKITENEKIDTVAIDSKGSTLHINNAWYSQLGYEEQASVLAHEVYHYALMHELRRGDRDEKRYQRACDIAVNNLLVNTGFTLPADFEVDPNYKNLAAEQIYELLEDEQDDGDDGKSQSSVGNDLFNPDLQGDKPNPESNPDNGNSPTQQEIQEAIAKITDNVMKANVSEELTHGKGIGESIDAFKEHFKKLAEGKLHYITILQEYLDELIQGDLSWNRLERRYLAYDIYCPSNLDELAIDKVTLAFDVSGSISKKQFEATLRELVSIKNQLNPKLIELVTFNTRIVEKFTYEDSQELGEGLEFKMGGGTAIRPVMKHLEENPPQFLIVFTDLEIDDFPKTPPNYNVIWVCIDNPDLTAPFGKVIHITKEELTNDC